MTTPHTGCRRAVLGLAVSAVLAAPVAAQAASTEFFSASVGRLTFIGLQTIPSESNPDLSGLSFDSALNFDAYLEDGAGVYTVSADGSAAEIVGPLGADFEIEAYADGYAETGGYSEAGSEASAFLTVVNDTPYFVELTYAFDYAVDTGVIGERAGDDAFADAYFELDLNGLTELLFASSDLAFGPEFDSFSDSFVESFIVDPQGSLQLGMMAGASGYAAPVPVPAALPLLGSAMGLLAWRARRRRPG